MNIGSIFEALYAAAIVTMFIIAGPVDPIHAPYRLDVCLVGSGPNGEDVSTNIWSDLREEYFKRYPGSFCGTCKKSRSCPKD